MARSKAPFTHASEAVIKAGMVRGLSAEEIAGQLRANGLPGSSRATVTRRMAEILPSIRAERSASLAAAQDAGQDAPDEELPVDPDDLPSDASVTELVALRARCKVALNTAETDGDLKLVGQFIRVSAVLEELIRKATPPSAEDPNDHPDMVRLGKEVHARLHAMVDMVCGS